MWGCVCGGVEWGGGLGVPTRVYACVWIQSKSVYLSSKFIHQFSKSVYQFWKSRNMFILLSNSDYLFSRFRNILTLKSKSVYLYSKLETSKNVYPIIEICLPMIENSKCVCLSSKSVDLLSKSGPWPSSTKTPFAASCDPICLIAATYVCVRWRECV